MRSYSPYASSTNGNFIDAQSTPSDVARFIAQRIGVRGAKLNTGRRCSLKPFLFAGSFTLVTNFSAKKRLYPFGANPPWSLLMHDMTCLEQVLLWKIFRGSFKPRFPNVKAYFHYIVPPAKGTK